MNRSWGRMAAAMDPRFSFDRFIIGPTNQVAAAAALRAADSPGRTYNPLVISGPAGVGKTHLLMAIAQRARALDPELLIHFETAAGFVDGVTTAISTGTLEEFRAATGGVGLFLLDGLAGLAEKARSEEELVVLADALVGRGAQLVVAAEVAPPELPALDPKLLKRLNGGLNVEIAPPDGAIRRQVVARYAAERDRLLSDEVLSSLADLPFDSVRALTEAVTRLLAESELESREVRPEDVSRLAAGLSPEPSRDGDEFGEFLTDISTAVAAVVETAPWRRRLAEAILRWEGEGIRTRRLEAALDADSAPDVEALLTAFGRDVSRLRRIARELPERGLPDPLLLRDPDRLQEAERLLAEMRFAARSDPEGDPGDTVSRAPSGRGSAPGSAEPIDRWFLDREKLAWDWLALDDRLVEEQR